MSPWFPHTSPEGVCKAVANVGILEEKAGRLAARPWNMYQPDTSPWWLIPNDADGRSPWPAHQVGKFYFCYSDDRSRIRVGFHVEKGLSTEAAATYPAGKAKSWKMTEDWSWWRVLRDIENGAFQRVVSSVASATALPIGVWMGGGYPVPVGDPRLPSDSVAFFWNGTGLSCSGEPSKMKVLPPLLGVTNFAEIGRALFGFPKDGFTWIDLEVGVEFHVRPQPASATNEEWGAKRIAGGLLAPFAEWVR